MAWTKPRMADEEFFALPEYGEYENRLAGKPAFTFGMAPLKEEGMPIYRDGEGWTWIEATASDGTLCKAPLV